MGTMEYMLIVIGSLFVFANAQASEPTEDRRDLAALWTTWGRWSRCSRSCDIGVTSRRRYCVARDGNKLIRMDRDKCPDIEREMKVCKGEPCDQNKPSPREAQCTEKNHHQFGGRRRYEWYPYTTSGNPCLLGCMAKRYGFFYSFGPAVDGTRCHNQTQDICVGGYCRTVGCDGMIGSNAEIDYCGICGGRNRKCFHFKSVFSDELPQDGNFGYALVAKIPIGARHVTVRDSGDNYLAMADSNMSYIFNGNFKVTGSAKFNSSGTMIEYDLHDRKSEMIKIDGPTSEELNLMVIFLNPNPGISYEYWIPRDKFPDIHSLVRKNQREQATVNRQPSTNTARHQGARSRDPASRSADSRRQNYHRQRRPLNSNSNSNVRQRQIGTYNHHAQRRHRERHPNPVTSSPLVTSDKTLTSVSSVQTTRSIFSQKSVTKHKANLHHTNRHHHHHQQHHQQQRQHNTHHQKPTSQTHSSSHHHTAQHKHKRRFRPYRRRRPNSSAFLSDQALCPSCQRGELTKENYCKSDFVVKAKVLWYDIIGDRTRYVVKLLRTYHNKLPLMIREYVWSPNKCRCPHLQQYKDYILTGRLVTETGSRESRLMVSPSDFSDSYGSAIEKEVIALKSKCTKQ